MQISSQLLSASLLAIALLSSLPSQAEVYKWTDTGGITHYTQTPPPKDSNAKDVQALNNLMIGKGKPAEPAKPTEEPKGSDTAEAKAEQDKAREEGEKNKKRLLDYCLEREKALNTLLSGAVVRFKQGNEPERILTADERKEKIAQIQKESETLCTKDVLEAAKSSSE